MTAKSQAEAHRSHDLGGHRRSPVRLELQNLQPVRYPPAGYRRSGPIRGLLYGGADYLEHADETIVTIAQIETAEALENLDQILATRRLDAVYIGPNDLGLSLGLGPGGMDSDWPALVEAIDAVLAAARAHGVEAGIHTNSPQYAIRMLDKGFQFVTIASDSRLLAAAASRAVAEVRAAGYLAADSERLAACPRRVAEGEEARGADRPRKVRDCLCGQ